MLTHQPLSEIYFQSCSPKSLPLVILGPTAHWMLWQKEMLRAWRVSHRRILAVKWLEEISEDSYSKPSIYRCETKAQWDFPMTFQPMEGVICSSERAQLCPILCNSMDYTVQARILEWVAFPFSKGSSQLRDWNQVSHIACGFFTNCATSRAQEYWSGHLVKATQCKSQSLHPNQIPFTSTREYLYVKL